ncbi:MAG TPA: tetratricopeptide repeat protein [Candidatus Deferrimicrobiaceae bacterium]|nr:tetratricopeptide repeat protein [Candidatus Deferrimicrobiaceae bacterium]
MTEASVPEASTDGATTSTLTFLFSDIEGSTRLQEQLGTEAYAAVLERHKALLRAAFAAHGGREEGTEGDSFFVVFESPREAVVAAVEAQRALAAEPWPDGVELRVRMGIHAGEARVAPSGLVGLDINRAARIAAAANGGQIIVSEAIRELTAADVAPEISLRGLGSHRLKDLREPQPLCQIVADGLRLEFPPLRSLDARPNNLPTQLTSFVGREHELAEVRRLLAANRLVTLTGPGGTGKTRLALQAAADAADDYPDGVYFVALETVREPTLVEPRIASSIGLAEGGIQHSGSTLRDWLVGKRVLLVLDNFEQVVAAGPVVADLLRDAPGLSVMATSRAVLRISGEQEYPVPGLPVPPDPSSMPALEVAQLSPAERALDPAVLSTYEAVKLFIARAAAVRPDFAVTSDNAPSVAAIVARLHGMPLAIELAAARVKLLAPDAILARLESRLSLLSAGSRDLPERQQTLRGAIAWSYDILDENCRRHLDRLSVFEGGFDLPATEAVCGPAEELGMDVLDGLVSLADQSLIRTVDAPGEPRFQMLDTIREFAAEQLVIRGEADAIRDRHARWFLELAEGIAPQLAGAEQGGLLDRLERDHDNIRAVLDRALAKEDAGVAIRLAFAVWRFWQKRGHLHEARRRLDAIATQPWSRTEPMLRARLREALGGVCWWQGDVAAMRPLYREAVEIWRSLDDRAELANALYNYAFAFSIPESPGESPLDSDPSGEGMAVLEEALGLYRELGDRRGEANVLWGMGQQEYFKDLGDAGAEMFRRSLELFREVGDRTMEAWALHMLGGSLIRHGDSGEARTAFRHALRHFYAAGDTAGITMVLDDLSSEALAQDEPLRAAKLWGAARSLTQTTGASLASFTDTWLEARVRPSVRVALDPEELERGAREGAALTLDEAVAYALDRPVGSLGSLDDEAQEQAGVR